MTRTVPAPAAGAAGLRDLPNLLDLLRASRPPADRALSVYLDTSPQRLLGQGHLLAFRDGCKALRPGLAPQEQTRFEAAVAQAEQFLAEALVPRAAGLALFASGEPGYFHAASLPAPPPEEVTWSEQPLLEPAEAVLDDCERIAVVLVDKERTRILTVFLGEIEERRLFEDAVPGKQATGDWFGLAQSRYARHHEDHVLRHVKRTTRALMATLRSYPFDRLLLAGPDEALALLRRHLPRPLRARLAGTLHLELFASEAQVLQATRVAAEAIERQTEVALVDELVEAATAPHTALGLAPTLAALGEDRVHRLLLAGDCRPVGGACPACGRLVAGLDPCPACGGPATPLDDLRERMIERARAQGASVEIVSGAAAARLLAHGGAGAWTRY